MVYKITGNSHTGTRRLSERITIIIAFASFITTILSVAYARILFTAPRKFNDGPNYEPAAWYLFCYPFLPFVSLLHSVAEFALLRKALFNKPWQCSVRCFVIWVYMTSWVIVELAWWFCDFGSVPSCAQGDVYYPGGDKSESGDDYYVAFFSRNVGLTWVKISCGLIVLAMYVIYVPISSFAIQRAMSLKKLAAIGRRERIMEDIELGALPRPGSN